MKIFIYKTLIVSFVFLIIFEVLVGSRINKLESQISNLKSPKNLELIKNKIFKEIKNGTKKENYFTNEEREILSKFIYKITSELNTSKKSN
tara:strand:+ start:308 stop:580 length:273 start_codon:yes stop_codon:yes gene_type:complete